MHNVSIISFLREGESFLTTSLINPLLTGVRVYSSFFNQSISLLLEALQKVLGFIFLK